MISCDTLITEVRNILKQYDTAGLIDDITCIDVIFKGLKSFGNLITTLQDTTVKIEDGRGTLPDNFSSLKLALKTERSHYSTTMPEDHLQQTYFWKERVERSDTWNRCETCEKEFTEKTIVEKIYLHNYETKFHYKNPVYLRVGKHIKKDIYAKDCENLRVKNSPYEISINNKTVYTNFPEGDIFVRYYGLELDDEGKPYIPETPQDHLETYLKYALQRTILQNIWLNSDDAGIESKIQFLLSQEREQFNYAMTDVKADSLTLRGLYKIEKNNKRRSSVFELN